MPSVPVEFTAPALTVVFCCAAIMPLLVSAPDVFSVDVLLRVGCAAIVDAVARGRADVAARIGLTGKHQLALCGQYQIACIRR